MASRLILHTGKGGAGTTTAAAATAWACAARGRRTLLLAVGQGADGLDDVLGTRVGATPAPLGATDAPSAVAVRPAGLLEAAGPSLRGWLDALLGAGRGSGAAGALELPPPPGAGAVAALLALARHADEDAWDVVVADVGPTGALRELLAAADLARWALERVLPRRARGGGGVGAGAARALDLPLPGDGAVAEAAGVARRLLAAADVLADPERCSARLVVAPGRAGLAAAERAATSLALREVAVDAVLCAPGADAEAARTAFGVTPVLAVPAGDDPRAIGAGLFAGRDPSILLRAPAPGGLVLGSPDAELRLVLPFAAPEEVTVRKVGARLLVGVRGDARTIVLPDAVADWAPTSAELRDGALHVGLREPAGA